MDNSKHLVAVQNNLSSLLETKKGALPKDFNQTRFMQNCMVVLQDTKDIEQMEAKSVARTMLKGAFLGLDFFNKECYAIGYNKNTGTYDKPVWIKELQFQTDYKGEKKLAKKYSINPIKDIYAKVVREDDVFEEYIKDGKQVLNFNPKPFSDKKIVGAFAVALFVDGTIMYEVMSVKEIEQVKVGYAKTDKNGAYSKAWQVSYGEMCKKTVYRRLCKHIELDFDTIEQKQAWDESSEIDLDKKPVKQTAKSSLDNIVEAELVEENIKEEGGNNENN